MKNISDNDFVFKYSRILFLYGYNFIRILRTFSWRTKTLAYFKKTILKIRFTLKDFMTIYNLRILICS